MKIKIRFLFFYICSVITFLLGVGFCLYVGTWWCFFSGTQIVVDQIKAYTLGLEPFWCGKVIWGILRVSLTGFLGFTVAIPFWIVAIKLFPEDFQARNKQKKG